MAHVDLRASPPAPDPRADAPAPPAAAVAARGRPTLGSLLSDLRRRQGWTLKEMSEHVGIPTSTLSKVERDRLTLTYDKLQRLGERLGMRMSELFAEPGDEPPADRVTARRSIGTTDAAVHVATPNYDYFYLFPELRRKRMVPILTHVRARTLAEFGGLVRHAGEEFIFVVSGAVVVHTEFYEVVRLGEGEAIYLDSNMGHAYLLAPGCAAATVIGACSSEDEDQMRSLIDMHESA